MADIGNPIRFEDLFHSDLTSGLDGLIGKVEEVEGSLLKMIKEVKKEASTLGEALSGSSSATKGDRDATSQYAMEIERLYKENERLSKSLDKVSKDLASLRRQKSSDSGDNINLANSYSTLSQLISETGVNIEELLQSEKQLNVAKKNGETANKALVGSYNQLYAQYNLVKNVLNAMGKEMRENEAIGKKWEAQAYSLMQTMKGMQEATGKYTLSVGNYGEATTKALNGLNISTQQVLREMPTLANSVSQFFIAISNNVPIFVDQLKRVQQESGSWLVAMKGVVTSIISWQTALLVVLTILPKVAKAIHDKRKANEEEAKAQEKATKEAKKAEETFKSLLVIYNEIVKASIGSVTELKVLGKILDDTNSSWENRIDAGKRLKQIFEDELASFSAEDIALGKAKVQMQNLTQFIYEQAKARATLNKITELTQKYIELEGQAKLYEGFRYGTKTVKELSDALYEASKTRKQVYIAPIEQKAVDEYRAIVSEMKGYQNQINRLSDQIQAKFLLEDIDGRGKATSEKLKDYYWQWRESIVNAMEEEEEREIALNNLRFEHTTAILREELEEQKAQGKLSVEQEKYITEIIINLETERQRRKAEIVKEYYDKTWKEIKKGYDNQINDEIDTDLALSNIHARTIAEISNRVIASREKLNDKLENGTYREAKNEGKIFNNLLKEKIRIEAQTQKEILDMRKFTGELTQDEYDKELAKLIISRDKAIAKLDKTRRHKFDLRTLIFGKAKEDGNGHVFKEIDEEMKAFLDAVENGVNIVMDYMDEWMDKRIEMAQVAIDAAQREREAAKETYDYEQEARVNGYANNVELARREYEEKLAIERKAIEEKKRLEKIQENINTVTQLSSLVTAVAEIWASVAGAGPFAPIIAAVLTATMFGSFAAAKIQAAQLASTKYGDGMSEYLDYGGSHASGNDIDFGRDKHGRQRRVERGEMIGVINKRNVDKYGVGKITDIIGSLNDGTFERKYNTTSETEAINQLIMRQSILKSLGVGHNSSLVDSLSQSNFDDKYGLAFNGLSGGETDLSLVEQGISRLVEQGETKVVATSDGRIEYKGNNKRIIHNS